LGGEIFWFLLILFVAQIILGELLRPKIQDNAKAATLKDFNTPTADETRSVPVVWGTALVDGPNVLWYGDLNKVKLTKKVKSGLFSSTRLTLAFRYSIGMQFLLCHGPIDSLLEVRTNDKVAFSGNVTGGTSDDGEDFVVDARTIYGGDSDEQLESGGTGGLYAACTLYKGTGTQNASPYMASTLATEIPAHRGIAHLIWKGPSSGNKVYNYDLGDPTIVFTREPFLSGYVGTNPNINPLSFVVRRLPNILSGSSDTYYNINDGDANPADILVELITNDEWGMGRSTALIDIPSFKAAQIQLFNEGLGFSGVWDSPRQITEVMDEILGLIDGVIYVDLSTGLLTIKLARKDYDPDLVLTLDEDTIVEITDFSRGSWDETTNEVVVTYIDRFQKFKEKTALAQDLANARIQDQLISTKTSYVGISNKTTASKIAFRALRVLTIPLAKCVIKLNRKGISLRPGSVFKLAWPDFDISQLIFRCTRVRYGEFENGMMEIDAVQDVFSLSESAYGASEDSGWVNPVGGATVPTNFTTMECPYFFSGNDLKTLTFTEQPDSAQLSFNTFSSLNNVSYVQVDSGDTFTPVGTLNNNYSDITNDIDTVNTLTIVPNTPDNLIFLQNFTSDFIKTGENLFVITDGTKYEICAFEEVTQSSGNYILSKIWRGLLDTVPQSWSTGATVWFFSYGNAFPNQTYSSGSTVYTKVSSIAATERSALTSAQTTVLMDRALKPYPPAYFRINAATSTVNISAGSNIVIDWEPRNRVEQGETVFTQFQTGLTAEPRTEYYIKFFNASNTLLRTVGPLTTNTYTYLNTDQVADNSAVEPLVVTVQLYSKRDGLFSLYPQQRTLLRPTGVAPSAPAYSPGSDSYVAPPADDAVSINGIPVCTNTPTNGQTLVYDSTAGCWKPQTLSVTLSGDVTGPSNSNTVVKLQNRDLSPSAPVTNDFLGWNPLTSKWEPKNISTGSSGSTALTIFSDVSESHTANSTWEDIGDMTLAYTPPEISNMYAVFTCEVVGNSADNEHIAFRFQLDGTTNSETWIKSKDVFPSNNEKHLIEIHTVFENVTANTSHSIKVQWQDNGSNLNVTVYNRRLTLITCKSNYDSNFDPSVLSGLQYWFAADSLTGLLDGDPVDSMLDFSGNSRDFDASLSPDTRGIYKTNQVNSLPCLRFSHDGSATTTTNTTYTATSNFLSSYAEGEIFVVIKAAADPATSDKKGSWANFGTDINISHYSYVDGTVYDDFGTSTRKNTGNPATNLATWNLYNITSKANSWVSRINGTQFYSTSSNTVAWNTAAYFGGNAATDFDSGFDGDIAEVIFYNRALNSSERSQIRTYISAKYGV